jgi:hypothetical protein
MTQTTPEKPTSSKLNPLDMLIGGLFKA